jgi:hypothetical protein
MKTQGNRPDFGSCLAPVSRPEVAAPSEHRLEAYATSTPSRRQRGPHGDSHQDVSERSLKSPENQCSIALLADSLCSYIQTVG